MNIIKKIIFLLYDLISRIALLFFRNAAIIVCDSHGRYIFSLNNSSNKILLFKAQPTKLFNLVLFWTNLTSYKFIQEDYQNWILKKINSYKPKYLIIFCGEISR